VAQEHDGGQEEGQENDEALERVGPDDRTVAPEEAVEQHTEGHDGDGLPTILIRWCGSIMDRVTIEAVESHARVGLPVGAEAVLLIEVDGVPEAVERETETVAGIVRECGGSVRTAADDAEREQFWAARRAARPALARVSPTTILEDATVPRSRLTDMLLALHAIAEEHGLMIGTFGHAGDGNLHPNILFDKRDPDEWHRVEQVSAEIFGMAVELGGTLTGEHGVGVLKQPYLELALGKRVIDLQREIKKVFDPKGLLNPGKKFPAK
jgi:glycolate oxidase